MVLTVAAFGHHREHNLHKSQDDDLHGIRSHSCRTAQAQDQQGRALAQVLDSLVVFVGLCNRVRFSGPEQDNRLWRLADEAAQEASTAEVQNRVAHTRQTSRMVNSLVAVAKECPGPGSH